MLLHVVLFGFNFFLFYSSMVLLFDILFDHFAVPLQNINVPMPAGHC